MTYPPQKLGWFPHRRLNKTVKVTFPTNLDSRHQRERFHRALWSWGVSRGLAWINTAPTEEAPTRDDVFTLLRSEAKEALGYMQPSIEASLIRVAKAVIAQWDERVAERFLTGNMKYTEEDFESVSEYGAPLAAKILGCSVSTIQRYRASKKSGVTVYERLRRIANYAKSLVKRDRVQPDIVTRAHGMPIWKVEKVKAAAARFYRLEPMKFTESPSTFKASDEILALLDFPTPEMSVA